MLCACHLSYVQVFAMRQDMEITVSLVGTLGAASYYYHCLFTASNRVGQGKDLRGRQLRLE